MSIELARRGAVTHLVLRPDGDGRVCLDAERIQRLHQLLAQVAEDRACRVLVLKSAGSELCRGLDLAAVLAELPERLGAATQALASCFLRLVQLPQAVVVVVDGPVLGGGIGLVACADLVLATDAASFQLPELCLGLTPALVTPVALRRMSPQLLRSWALAGQVHPAGAAQAAGLVDQVVAREQLGPALRALIKQLLRTRPAALATFKRDLFPHQDQLAGALEQAAERTAAHLQDPELRAQLQAFLDGYAPSWFDREEASS